MTEPTEGPAAGPAIEVPHTGHPQVDAAVAAVAGVRDAAPAAQVVALTQAQQVLAATLDNIDKDL